MSVSVDYDDDSAVDVIYSVWGSEAWLSDVDGEVDDRGNTIYEYLQALEDSADYAAEYALAAVGNLKNFHADVTQVTFTAPAGPNIGVEAFGVDAPDIADIDVQSADLDWTDLDLTPLATTLEPDIDVPADVPDAIVPDAPQLSPGTVMPYGPSDYNFPNTTVPGFTADDFDSTVLQAPDLADVQYLVPDPIEFTELALNIDTGDLDDAIARFQNMPTELVNIPGYDDILPEIFDATGGLINGFPTFDPDVLDRTLADLRDPRQGVVQAFERRGIDVADIATDWVEQAVGERIDRHDAVFSAKVEERCIVDGYKVATAATLMQNDIELKLYDLDFAAKRAAALAYLEIAKAVAAVYAAQLLSVQTSVANYNAQAANLKAKAQAFVASSKSAQVTGDLNKQLAALFAVEERVKGTESDLFKAQLRAESAKLTAYGAKISSYAAAVVAAEADVAGYTAKAQGYAAEVDRVSTGYEIAAIRARTGAIENRAKIAKVESSSAQIRGLASSVQATAAAAAAQATRLGARAQQRELPYEEAALRNSETAGGFSSQAQNYALRIAEYTSDLRSRQIELGGISDQARLTSRFLDKASSSAERAANVMARANEELARAYARVYDAAGKAGAAIESGKLSGFRASATLSASDALNSSKSQAVSWGTSGANGFSESFNRSLNVSA